MEQLARVEWKSMPHPISDIRDWSRLNRLEMQPEFQRNQVWSKAAKIMLIDTILRNIPMPKIFLQGILRQQDTYRIVIDGQQRLTAILEFLNDGFALDSPYVGPYKAKRFSELPSSVQDEILNYNVDTNEIRNATKETIRDIYSRVNKYTVQLNKQELRRADYPGDFLKTSEHFAHESFFEENRVFTIASSKRMGDVEFVSELLALLLDGPQEKKEKLDYFYSEYANWPKESKEAIIIRFRAVVEELQTLWMEEENRALKPFAKTRFRQKADFYALFNAIDDLLIQGGGLSGKDLGPLRKDIAFLDERIEPESEIQLFRKYAIQCVSQSNTVGSRRWRRNVLKAFLAGTYVGLFPVGEIARTFHNILIESRLPFGSSVCPICGKAHSREAVGSSNVVIAWKHTDTVFQLSNAVLLHNSCLPSDSAKSYRIPEPYETGDLDDSEFRAEK